MTWDNFYQFGYRPVGFTASAISVPPGLEVAAAVLAACLAALTFQRLPAPDGFADLPAVRPALALSLAWLFAWPFQLAWPFQRPWYDVVVICLLAVYPASWLDGIVRARLLAGDDRLHSRGGPDPGSPLAEHRIPRQRERPGSCRPVRCRHRAGLALRVCFVALAVTVGGSSPRATEAVPRPGGHRTAAARGKFHADLAPASSGRARSATTLRATTRPPRRTIRSAVPLVTALTRSLARIATRSPASPGPARYGEGA